MYNFDTVLYQFFETGTSDRCLICKVQRLRFSGFILYPLSFFLYSTFKLADISFLDDQLCCNATEIKKFRNPFITLDSLFIKKNIEKTKTVSRYTFYSFSDTSRFPLGIFICKVYIDTITKYI